MAFGPNINLGNGREAHSSSTVSFRADEGVSSRQINRIGPRIDDPLAVVEMRPSPLGALAGSRPAFGVGGVIRIRSNGANRPSVCDSAASDKRSSSAERRSAITHLPVAISLMLVGVRLWAHVDIHRRAEHHVLPMGKSGSPRIADFVQADSNRDVTCRNGLRGLVLGRLAFWH